MIADPAALAEALLACECGHDMDEHNGLGCYARLSYEPLVKCDCRLTDDRTYADLLSPRLARLIAEERAEAFETALAQVTSGVRSAMEAHRAHGHRQIVAALSGLLDAIPNTENPYRVEAEHE